MCVLAKDYCNLLTVLFVIQRHLRALKVPFLYLGDSTINTKHIYSIWPNTMPTIRSYKSFLQKIKQLAVDHRRGFIQFDGKTTLSLHKVR